MAYNLFTMISFNILIYLWWCTLFISWQELQIDIKEVVNSLVMCACGDRLAFKHIEAETKWPPFRRRCFKVHFFNENVWILLKISLKFVPKGPINNIPVLVQIMAWRRPGDKPLSEPMMVSFPTHICVTRPRWVTVYPKKYAHGFVVLCFVVVMQSFIMNSHEVFIHIHQGCFAGTGAIVRLPQCQWSKPDGYGKISQCITTTKHSKAKTVCKFLGIYCNSIHNAQSPPYFITNCTTG